MDLRTWEVAVGDGVHRGCG